MNCKGTYKMWHYEPGQAHKQKDPGHDPGWQVVLLMMQEDLYLCAKSFKIHNYLYNKYK